MRTMTAGIPGGQRAKGVVFTAQNCVGTPYHILMHAGSLKTGLALMGRPRSSSSGYGGPFNYDWAGALTALPPDGFYNGNARGQNAVDWQMAHSSNALSTIQTQVASGNFSVIGGGINNKASGLNSCVPGGTTNTASGTSSFAAGNSCIASNVSSVAIGQLCTCSGSYSTALGNSTTASGSYGALACGWLSQATATSTFAFGRQALADQIGMMAQAYGVFSAVGDAQNIQAPMRIKTTNATATTLMLDGGSTRLLIKNGWIFGGQVIVTGIRNDGSNANCFHRQVRIKNVGGTTALVGTVNLIGVDQQDDITSAIAITADDTNDALQINVTGVAAQTYRWTAVIFGTYHAYGS